MPYPKLKSENYSNLGGINTKKSEYLTGPTEFLDLQNVDAQTPGALSSMPGSTQWVIAGITGPITGISEFTSSPLVPFQGLIATTNYGAFDITGHTFSKSYTPLYYGPTYLPSAYGASLETYQNYNFVRGDYLYGCNQLEFFAAQSVGGSYWQYSMPFPWIGTSTYTTFGSTGGLSGILEIDFAFIRSDGLVGPFIGRTFITTGVSAISLTTPSLFGTPNGTTYSNYGISGLLAWYSLNGTSPKGTSAIYAPGAAFGLNDLFASYITTDPPMDILGSFDLGSTFYNTVTPSVTVPPIYSLNPSCIELFNNQMFMGGFYVFPDTVWYSNIGQYEQRDPENSFDVNPNDGERVSNIISYFTQLIIFKPSTTYTLSGTDPDNFTLTQATDQYGCLSNNSACVFEQKLWFLDKKGICEYNGANTTIVSNNVEPIFQRMNISAATVIANMTHVKNRNQVWCDIPVDGATYNNMRVVYDYLTNAWFSKPIDQLSCLSKASKSWTAILPRVGSASGMVYQYGQSLTLENGVAFTSLIKSRFLGDMGHSVEKMWRRLYIDATILSGSTQTFIANFYSDMSTTPALSMTLVMSDFQRRWDFGIPAANLSVELIYSGGDFLKINGFTIEYRFQRAVTGN